MSAHSHTQRLRRVVVDAREPALLLWPSGLDDYTNGNALTASSLSSPSRYHPAEELHINGNGNFTIASSSSAAAAASPRLTPLAAVDAYGAPTIGGGSRAPPSTASYASDFSSSEYGGGPLETAEVECLNNYELNLGRHKGERACAQLEIWHVNEKWMLFVSHTTRAAAMRTP